MSPQGNKLCEFTITQTICNKLTVYKHQKTTKKKSCFAQTIYVLRRNKIFCEVVVWFFQHSHYILINLENQPPEPNFQKPL